MITECFDLPILDWIAEQLWCPALDALMPAITRLGDGGAVWIALAALLLALPKQRKTGLTVALALLLGLLACNLTLKPLVARMRPFDYQLQYFGREISLLVSPPTDFSFPSGHTNASFAAATALLLRSRRAGIPAMLLAALIAFSRLYLYVHYPTDVLAAVALGAAVAFAANALVNKGYALYENRKTKNI